MKGNTVMAEETGKFRVFVSRGEPEKRIPELPLTNALKHFAKNGILFCTPGHRRGESLRGFNFV